MPLAREATDPFAPWFAAVVNPAAAPQVLPPVPEEIGAALWHMAARGGWESQAFLLSRNVPGVEAVSQRPALRLLRWALERQQGKALDPAFSEQIAAGGSWSELERWTSALGQPVTALAAVRWMEACGWSQTATQMLSSSAWQKAFTGALDGKVKPEFWQQASAPFDFAKLAPLVTDALLYEQMKDAARAMEQHVARDEYGHKPQIEESLSSAWQAMLQLNQMDKAVARPVAKRTRAARKRV